MLCVYIYIIKAKKAVEKRGAAVTSRHCSAGVIIGDGKIYAASPSESLLNYYTPTRARARHAHTPVQWGILRPMHYIIVIILYDMIDIK